MARKGDVHPPSTRILYDHITLQNYYC